MSDPRITIVPKGPFKVEGGIPLQDNQGNPVDAKDGKAYFLCRCGASKNKPFCDGSHRAIDFEGEGA